MNNWSTDRTERFLDHYETLRGTVRQALVDRQLAEHLPEPPAKVCDVGGAGHQAIPLVRRGYESAILDPSEEMLRRAREALEAEKEDVRGRVTLVAGPGERAPELLGRAAFDAVLCHGVLPYLEDPAPLVEALAALARPGAVISVLTKNAAALAIRPGLTGRYREALAAFGAAGEVNRLGLDTRADTIPGMTSLLAGNGVRLERWYGVRVFTDHLDDRPAGPELEDALEAEWEAGRRDPYRGVARLVHLVGRKGADPIRSAARS